MKPGERGSTSPLMAHLFAGDLGPVIPVYRDCIDQLARRYPALEAAWRGCHMRAGFLLPHMLVEYGHDARTGELLSNADREAALALGLQSLAVCVDDDVADGQAGGLVDRVSSICVAELLQASAWGRLASRGARETLVRFELERFVADVTQRQHFDAVQIERAAAGDFRLEEYLQGTRKAMSLVHAGLRLGLALGGGDPERPAAERFSDCFGRAFQIVDDVRDLEEDLESFGAPVTLPMLLARRGDPLDRALQLAEEALDEGAESAAKLGPGLRLGLLVERLAETVAKLRVESVASR